MCYQAAIRSLIFFMCSFFAACAYAENPERNNIQKTAVEFLQQLTAAQTGEVDISVNPVDPRLNLSECNNLAPFLPPGARPWGKTSIGVRCTAPSNWVVYLQAHVKITADYYVAARHIAAGSILGMDDLNKITGEISSLPYAIITKPEQATGKSLQVGLAAGGLLRTDLLKSPIVIQQGQAVRVIVDGPGFHVATDAQALNNASEGQVAKARTSSGQTISGIAKASGVIEVSY